MVASTSAQVMLSGAIRAVRLLIMNRWSIRILGLVIFSIVLARIDLGGMSEAITSARLGLVLAALALTVPFFITKSYRWRFILRRTEIHISNRASLQLYGAGLFAGQVTPGQLGELVRARFLWLRGHDPVKSTFSVVVDRALDMVALVLVAIPGFGLVFGASAAVAVLIALLAMTIAVVLIRPRRVLRALAGKLGPRAQGASARVDDLIGSMEQSMRTSADAAVLALTTAAALGINMLRFYLLLVSLGLSLPIANFVFGVALANLLGLMPITVLGIGTRDAVMVLVFQQAGESAEGAVAFSLLILGVAYVFNLAWGFVAWQLEVGHAK